MADCVSSQLRKWAILCFLAFVIPLGSLPAIAQSAVPNDSFTNSFKLEGTNITVVGNGGNATLENGEPTLDPTTTTKTVWYSWVAPFNSRASFMLFPPLLGESVSIFTGPTVDHLQRLPRVQYAENAFVGMEGTVYHIQVDTTWFGEDFPFSLSATPLPMAGNDSFSNAFVMKGYSPTATATGGSIMGATLEPGEPQHRSDVAAKSVWWKWQAPVNGSMRIYVAGGLAPNPILAVYTGTTLADLTLHAKGGLIVDFKVDGGTTYYFAAAVPADATGDVGLQGPGMSPSGVSRQIPGNLLADPSFELGGSNPPWQSTNLAEDYLRTGGAADGGKWVSLSGGGTASLWQDLPTVTGRTYAIRFATVGYDSAQPVRMRVKWGDQVLGVVELLGDDASFWNWTNLTATATASTTRLAFENLAEPAGIDGLSVVWLNEPPSITKPPESMSTYTGGQAIFTVGVLGVEPFTYQWSFNEQPLADATNQTLVINPVSSAHAGQYSVVVSNAFGHATSPPATLVIETPQAPVIVLQPSGDTVANGGFFAFNVSAIGTPPLSYQWFYNDTPITDATNRQLVLNPVLESQAGSYAVQVSNFGGSTFSFSAALKVDNQVVGGGTVWLANRSNDPFQSLSAPVFDIDGLSKLSGPGFVAQLYAGPSADLLRAAGSPTPFLTGFFGSGMIASLAVTVPSVPPMGQAFAQIRVWEVAKGASYEEARALGGKFGRSGIVTVTLGSFPSIPPYLAGLQSFSLQAGLPRFNIGRIELAERKADGTLVWSLTGEAGYRYLIEKNSGNSTWKPLMVITNNAGSATFTDPSPAESTVDFYRSRILD